MGKYSVPEEIRKLKPKGTMVKNIKGLYYVYNYSSHQTYTEDENGKKHWKTKTQMGACIGSITLKDGFVPNEGHLSSDVITCKNFGDYAVTLHYSEKTYKLLSSVFHPDDAKQIYSAAVIFFVEGFTYMTSMKDIFELSYLSLLFSNVHLGYEAVHSLYTNLGTRGTKVHEFETMQIQTKYL